ncbi:OadG family transporter subunit [Porphyromonas asaccharolytica]|uniref:LTD domain-containing protein n=1 Tax=Porphyromonas asaccharolytica (strain ATCC 25260 / DSM 20707 / BCRC 10618 / CCUG 7834 / JCM 6326 / LMG 13178 / VPI 4198 / B440) TaxID=879243 RepID=F4KKA8_PORAD|nr:OadG family transporter subunit [Porphyromonas asaccharolytica]AEE12833.1 hypothetical protein Poras_0890 [Porphyromonas asaccharolytica DSM 20707]
MQRVTLPALQRLLLLSTIAALWSSLPLSSQSITAARINEVMIDNVDNYIDNYGKRSPWIEIYNSSAGSIDLAGCFLTDDPQNLKKYMIPKGDVLTAIKPRQSVVFFADEMPLRGTFHLNFTLAPDTPHYLALISNDGSTIIDEVEVPASLPANHSYARIDDGVRTVEPAEAWHITQHTTPGSNNVVKDKNEKMDRLQEADPNGFVMTITAMLVVFSGLLILFLAYKLVGIMAMRLEGRKESLNRRLNSRLHQEPAEKASTTEDPLVAVAISLALTSELEMGGGEAPGRLTIRPRTLPYTPWSDKSQMMRPTVDCKRLKA